jgi:hypothetical protein
LEGTQRFDVIGVLPDAGRWESLRRIDGRHSIAAYDAELLTTAPIQGEDETPSTERFPLLKILAI